MRAARAGCARRGRGGRRPGPTPCRPVRRAPRRGRGPWWGRATPSPRHGTDPADVNCRGVQQPGEGAPGRRRGPRRPVGAAMLAGGGPVAVRWQRWSRPRQTTTRRDTRRSRNVTARCGRVRQSRATAGPQQRCPRIDSVVRPPRRADVHFEVNVAPVGDWSVVLWPARSTSPPRLGCARRPSRSSRRATTGWSSTSRPSTSSTRPGSACSSACCAASRRRRRAPAGVQHAPHRRALHPHRPRPGLRPAGQRRRRHRRRRHRRQGGRLSAMGQVVELEIPARPDFLEVARMVVTTAASIEPTFPDERINDLRLAVSEACTNAIEAHVTRPNGDAKTPTRPDRAALRPGRGPHRGRGRGPWRRLRPRRPERARRRSPTRPGLDHERGLGITLMRDGRRRDRVPGVARGHRRAPRRLLDPPAVGARCLWGPVSTGPCGAAAADQPTSLIDRRCGPAVPGVTRYETDAPEHCVSTTTPERPEHAEARSAGTTGWPPIASRHAPSDVRWPRSCRSRPPADWSCSWPRSSPSCGPTRRGASRTSTFWHTELELTIGELVDRRDARPRGQRRPDGHLLLRGRPRDQARVRERRAARALGGGAARPSPRSAA